MNRCIAGALTLALASLLSAAPGDKAPTKPAPAVEQKTEKTEKAETATSPATHQKKGKKHKDPKPAGSAQ